MFSVYKTCNFFRVCKLDTYLIIVFFFCGCIYNYCKNIIIILLNLKDKIRRYKKTKLNGDIIKIVEAKKERKFVTQSQGWRHLY